MRRRLPVVLVLTGLVVFLGAVLSSRAPAHPTPQNTALAATPLLSARRVPTLLVAGVADPQLRTALASVVVDSPTDTCVTVEVDGRLVFTHQPDLALAPASNVKLLTAAAILHELGADYRFTTKVLGAAPVDGTVRGDVVLVGGGDPLLSTQAYRDHFADQPPAATSIEELADRLQAAGVRHITGRLLGDESRYDSVRTVPSWPARYYDQHQTGPLSALSLDQGKTSFPEHATEENERDVTVTDDPPRFAATTFVQLLAARGISVDGGPGVGTAAPGMPELVSIGSPPLRDLVRQMLSTSDNQAAEGFVKELGFTDGAGGTTPDGLAALQRALARLDLPTAGLVLFDGSGLDRDDRASCALVTAVLDHAGEESAVGQGLAVAGESGTLRERFRDEPVVGRLRAKTGTLNDVTALSGFADAAAGASITFSYIAVGATVGPNLLGIQDDLAEALVTYSAGTDLQALRPLAGP